MSMNSFRNDDDDDDYDDDDDDDDVVSILFEISSDYSYENNNHY